MKVLNQMKTHLGSHVKLFSLLKGEVSSTKPNVVVWVVFLIEYAGRSCLSRQ